MVRRRIRWQGATAGPKRLAVTCLVGAAAAALVGVAGCKAAEPIPPPVPEGPITTLEMPEGVALPALRQGNEPDRVEAVVFYRAMYARSLRALRDYYADQGQHTKRIWADDELRQVAQIKPYRYILDAEAPAIATQPSASIEAADSLYNEAVDLLDQAVAKSGKPDKTLLKRSLATFKELVGRYPASDKAAASAYFIGLIHDQYFPDDAQIALEWYQRAWQWDPKMQMPARFNAARIYDERLKDRVKALEMYRLVLAHETFNRANVDKATQRLVDLTIKGEERAEAALKAPERQMRQ